MAQTPPPALTAAPTPPDRTNRTTFAALAQAFTIWITVAFPQLVALALNVYNNCVDAYNNALASQAASSAATLAAGASMHNPATVYPNGGAAISAVNYLIYRRRSAGSSATDPSADAANWAASNSPAVVVTALTVNTAAVPNVVYLFTTNNVVLTLPTGTGVNEPVHFRLAAGVTGCSLARNTNLIEGLAEDHELDVPNDRGSMRNTGATYGWMAL